MFLSGDLKGVLIPPSIYNEFAWAYREQTDYLALHPGGGLIDTPISNQVGLDLQAELSRNVDEAVMVYLGITRLPRQSDDIPAPSGIRVEPPDVLHFIESFRRQASSLAKAALENAGTLEGEIAQTGVADVNRLVQSLHSACMSSRLQPQKLTFAYGPHHKPIRPPVSVLSGKGKWLFPISESRKPVSNFISLLRQLF